MESLEDFKIRAYSRNQFINMNFSRNTSICNNNPIDLLSFSNINETDYFVETIQNKVKKKSCIEDYLITMNLVQKINKKITQFYAQ
jgi:negative regulator of replication initiation